ncbi:MAG TPA: hypothetical protein VJU79_00530, partial [Candidatus Dormibacteraeota bacterium]|nr:hypothetical protein [Candidatus Dormibacteraeota bacterium]
RVGDPDYWWHELTGQWIVQHAAFARADLYTYTVGGTPWTDHEYGSQLLFYALRQAGGLTLTSLFFAAVVWAGFWLLYARIRQRDHAPVIAAAALVLAAGAGFPIWGPRPQMFDFTFVALLLYWLDRHLDTGSRAIYWTPLLTLVWANLHGGFVFGFFLLGLAIAALLVRWAWERGPRQQLLAVRRLGLVLAASVVASLITPWGPSLFVYVWRTQFSSQLSGFVREWQSPDFHMISMLPFLAMLLLVFIGMAWRRPRLVDVVVIVATAVVALRALLFIPIFIAAATPVLAWQWSEVWVGLRERLRPRAPAVSQRTVFIALAALLVAVTAGSLAFAANTLRGQTRATAANYPVAAADWLAAHPGVGTRMFNEYSWGGYLTYRFYPDPTRRLFIYGESELMGDELLAQYADINNLRSDWSTLLDRYDVDYIVFPVDAPLVSALDASSGWKRAYADSLAVIFVRSGAPG